MGENATDATMNGLHALFQFGDAFSSALGVTPERRESMYAIAYGLYSKGNFKEARRLFAQLVIHDPVEPRFMRGLAATTQMLGEYKQALDMYVVLAAANPGDPVPVMRAGDCLVALGRHAEAKESFEVAMAMCNEPARDAVKRRCESVLVTLRRHGDSMGAAL